MKKPFRKYKQSDMDLRIRAELVHDCFLEDKSDFVSMYTSFEDPFADDFLAAIDDIGPEFDDDKFKSRITLMIVDIQSAMEDARKLVTNIFSYIRIGFDGDRTVLKSFGSNDVKKAANSYSKMSNLLVKIKGQAELPENKAVLLGAGMTQSDIDMLGTLGDRIDVEFEKLSMAKSARIRNTKVRVEKLNKVYSFMQKLSAASKVVYSEDYASRLTYNLNFGRKKYTRKEDEKVEK